MMKKIAFIFLSMGIFPAVAFSQLKTKPKCGDFVVDILNGNVSGMKPGFTEAEIKVGLPCFTSAEDEDAKSKCGGGVFYADRDVYFYTQRDYIEIGENFKGQLSIPLLGADRSSLFRWLGNPKLSDDGWDAFQTAYGTLVLHYNKDNKVRLIQFSSRSTETLNLCE